MSVLRLGALSESIDSGVFCWVGSPWLFVGGAAGAVLRGDRRVGFNDELS